MFQTSNLYQNDPQWKDVPLGGQTSETIGSWGCLMTSMTMMLNGMGYHETPLSVNDKMKAYAGFQGALIIPVVLPIVYPNVVYKGFASCAGGAAPLSQIDEAVAAGNPVIVQVDWSPSDGLQTHWLLIKDKVGDDYSIYDPYQYLGDDPAKEVLLAQRYTGQGSTAAQAISAVMWFEGMQAPSQLAQQPAAPVPVNALTLSVNPDDLALRDKPDLSGCLLKRLLAGTALVCLEDPSAARAKVGRAGQWLNVQDPASQQGFVAAGYISETPTQQPDLLIFPPASFSVLVVSPIQEGTTLRSRPVISPQTVVKVELAGERMTVLEPAAAAAAKIGTRGQWLDVCDSSGQGGYVAAWQVQVVSGKPALASAPVSGPMFVHTTSEGVALRSQPVVSNDTLIQRLPAVAQLVLVDPTAASKIGAVDQWLQVQAPDGSQGYIAAWFVAR